VIDNDKYNIIKMKLKRVRKNRVLKIRIKKDEKKIYTIKRLNNLFI
jgi:hypothetical protein